MLEPKECPACKQLFTPKLPKQTFCSRPCVAESYKKRVVKHCEMCGKETIAKIGGVERKRFCSRVCAMAALTQRTLDKQVDVACQRCGKVMSVSAKSAKSRKYCSYACQRDKPSTKIVLACAHCGKEYERFPCRLNDGKKNYCCRKCKHLDQLKDGVHVQLTCASCGKEYTTTIHQVEKRGSNYCGKECMDNGKRTRNHAYAYLWRKIATEIRERDNNTCRICGLHQTIPSLHVHHIMPARLFGIDNLRQANHPHNLITLCMYCHRTIENQPINLDLFKITGLIPGQIPLFVQECSGNE